MADRRILIPEIVQPGYRNGRHINHDEESLRYLTAPRGAAVQPKPVDWERHTPIYNQGQIGSCVANTGGGILSCDPFWDTLDRDLQRMLVDPTVAQRWCVELYRELTKHDPFPGAYEPDDTGTDGLTLAKRLKVRGLISGYTHATSLAALHAGLQQAPQAVGTVWTSDMQTPDREGIIRSAGGVETGGHEYLVRTYDARRDLFGCDNHWTDGWGDHGRFWIPSAVMQQLLSRQGDCTNFVPRTAPAPTPAGPVSPVVDAPTPVPDDFPVELVEPWVDGKHYTRRETRAADAIEAWLSRHSS